MEITVDTAPTIPCFGETRFPARHGKCVHADGPPLRNEDDIIGRMHEENYWAIDPQVPCMPVAGRVFVPGILEIGNGSIEWGTMTYVHNDGVRCHKSDKENELDERGAIRWGESLKKVS